MKKIIAFLAILLITISCQDAILDKPDNLIEEEKMVEILTDIAILEAIKVENPASLTERNIKPADYIYKKYKIKSLQFLKSNKYYASDVAKYEKIYEKVAKNIEKKKAEAEALIEKGVNVGTPKPKKKEIKKEEKFARFRQIFKK